MPSRLAKGMFCFTLNPPDNSSGTLADESGQGMVEYGLMTGLAAALVIAALVVLGPMLRDMLEEPVSQEEQGDREAAVSSAIYQ